MARILRNTIAFGALALIGAACGGPQRYIQAERPTACQPGTQPAIIDFKRDNFGHMDREAPVWECRPSCGADKEYVSLVREGHSAMDSGISVRPQCMATCKTGWARKYANFPKPGMQLPGSAANCDTVDGLQCYPVSEDAKAEYAKDHQECVKTEAGVAESSEKKRDKTKCVGLCRGKQEDCEASCKLRFGPLVSSNPQCWQACTDDMKSCASVCQ